MALRTRAVDVRESATDGFSCAVVSAICSCERDLTEAMRSASLQLRGSARILPGHAWLDGRKLLRLANTIITDL
jgi:hypothetical protein